ncbi:hypothetical protein DPMN_082064 [Dreissena polymorpha]|uniref:Uncharacterized protein n=1 Tax=Dreissena polymorpha TaxID=45954 RepID=A0A9D3YA74_DREPO|nr:hypothetical protein DPMN_082064 [Dreissena polymorpha]
MSSGLYSEHFGRTPLCTPAHSQELSSDDYSGQVEDASNAVKKNRIGSFVFGQPVESSSDSNDDDDSYDGDAFSQDNSIRRFHEPGCGCAKKCHEKYDASLIRTHILETREMTREEKEMYIKGCLSEGPTNDSTKRGKKRMQIRGKYTYRGQEICAYTLRLLFDKGRCALKSIRQSLNKTGPGPRRHGNTGRKPQHALVFTDVERVVQFFCNIAEEFGIPQPAAPLSERRYGTDIPTQRYNENEHA